MFVFPFFFELGIFVEKIISISPDYVRGISFAFEHNANYLQKRQKFI